MTVYHIEDNKYVCRGTCLRSEDIKKYLLNCYHVTKYDIVEVDKNTKAYWLEHWRV